MSRNESSDLLFFDNQRVVDWCVGLVHDHCYDAAVGVLKRSAFDCASAS